MTGTTKQIEYANDLMTQFYKGIAAWKAMIPAGHPKAAELTARIDAAAAKAQTLQAGTVIDILRDRRDDQAAGQELVRWTGMAVKCFEQA